MAETTMKPKKVADNQEVKSDPFVLDQEQYTGKQNWASLFYSHWFCHLSAYQRKEYTFCSRHLLAFNKVNIGNKNEKNRLEFCSHAVHKLSQPNYHF